MRMKNRDFQPAVTSFALWIAVVTTYLLPSQSNFYLSHLPTTCYVVFLPTVHVLSIVWMWLRPYQLISYFSSSPTYRFSELTENTHRICTKWERNETQKQTFLQHKCNRTQTKINSVVLKQNRKRNQNGFDLAQVQTDLLSCLQYARILNVKWTLNECLPQ